MEEEFKHVCYKLIVQNEDALKQARQEVKITSKKKDRTCNCYCCFWSNNNDGFVSC